MNAVKIKPIRIPIAIRLKNRVTLPVNHPVTKVHWETAGRCNDTRVIKPFSVQHPWLGTLTVSIREVNRELDTFLIELKNSLKKVFSEESLIIEPKNQRIRGMNIQTAEEYRATKKGRKHGFGELIRLTSIMEMLENKCNSISIFSKNTAVYFHGKYKFKPNITDKKNALDILSNIINEKALGYKGMSEKAKKIYQELEEIDTLPDEQKIELFKKINNFINRYIRKVLSEGNCGQGHEFSKGMDMILTKRIIQREKLFFNKKYKTQGIDYKIQ